MKTYDDCKKQVAAERRFYGAFGFDEMITAYINAGDKGRKFINQAYAEAAELYMRHAANEAVKEDREELTNICEDSGHYIRRTIKNRPLPYPNEQ